MSNFQLFISHFLFIYLLVHLDYHCLGSWQENGTMYQIVKSKEEDGVRYCLSYNEIKSENNAEIKYIQMKVNSVNCRGDVTSQNYETVHLELIKKGKFV